MLLYKNSQGAIYEKKIMILVESNATEEEISLVSKNKTSLYDARSLCTTSMNGY
jgi:hypothetical protein